MNSNDSNHDYLADSIIAHQNTVFQVALGYVKNIHDADDIVQNVFFKLYRNKKTFVNDEAQKAWLIRVTVNECKDLLKSLWRRNRSDFDESLAAPDVHDSEQTNIGEYVRCLKPKYRTVIYLHYYEGYSTNEIARMLKMTQTAVTTQLNRARNQLKQAIISDRIESEASYGL
ncbi:MAG: RNA polymerase sigma factor [Oscillospiraceae bacterium]|nr:RNA polymerase sigma factor [Oscillospiraceae bacterium]